MKSNGEPSSPVTLIVAGGGAMLLGVGMGSGSSEGLATIGSLLVVIGVLIAAVGVVATGVRLGMALDRHDHKPPPAPLVPRTDR